jgi:hypothetical protein
MTEVTRASQRFFPSTIAAARQARGPRKPLSRDQTNICSTLGRFLERTRVRRQLGRRASKIADVAAPKTEDLPGSAILTWTSFTCRDLSLAGAGAVVQYQCASGCRVKAKFYISPAD